MFLFAYQSFMNWLRMNNISNTSATVVLDCTMLVRSLVQGLYAI